MSSETQLDTATTAGSGTQVGTTAAAGSETQLAATTTSGSETQVGTTAAAGSVSQAQLSKSGSLGIMAGLQICILLCAMDQTVLNTAIPRIATALGGFDRSMSIITSYLLFSTVATPIAGKLSDMFGAKSVLVVVTALFTLASGLCALAGMQPSVLGLDAMNQLIAMRALQGIAGGAMIGLCFVAIGEFFVLKDRGKLQGLLAASFVVAALIGPVLGGWLVDASTWRMIFYLNIPPGILACLCFKYCLQDSTRPRVPSTIDIKGILTLILSIFPLIVAAGEIGTKGQFDILSASLAALSLAMFCVFIWCEKAAKEPLIPLILFHDRIVAVSLLTVFVSGIGLFGSTLLLSVTLQRVLNVSALLSGLYLTPVMIAVAAASVCSGFLIGRTGKYKQILLAGLMLMSAGSFLLSKIEPQSGPWLLIAYAAIGGIGMGFILPVHTIAVQSIVSARMMGVGTSMTQFFRSLGGTVGTGIMSALMVCLIKQSSLSIAISEMFVLYGIAMLSLFMVNIFIPEASLKARKLPESERSFT